jgi:hypothetical protein
MTQRAASIETAAVKGFHPKLWRGEGNHNDALKEGYDTRAFARKNHRTTPKLDPPTPN